MKDWQILDKSGFTEGEFFVVKMVVPIGETVLDCLIYVIEYFPKCDSWKFDFITILGGSNDYVVKEIRKNLGLSWQ